MNKLELLEKKFRNNDGRTLNYDKLCNTFEVNKIMLRVYVKRLRESGMKILNIQEVGYRFESEK